MLPASNVLNLRPVHVVGVSGPDGAGKSTVIRLLLRSCPDQGAFLSVYLYGCFLCRRVPARRTHSDGETSQSSDAGFLLAAHGLIDALELWIRLSLAKIRARLLSTNKTAANIVLSDRSPLDGLAKHDPRAGSVTARAFGRLARSYDVIAWLDAEPQVLAGRDTEHARPELERVREAFTRWATLLPNVARIDATAPPGAVASAIRAAHASSVRDRIDA
jgi:thymidylate kinase